MRELESLARDFIGDGRVPNLFFVTNRGLVVTVTRHFQTAYDHWQSLASRYPQAECALEDRKTGVIAAIEPESDESNARLRPYDYTATFGYR